MMTNDFRRRAQALPAVPKTFPLHLRQLRRPASRAQVLHRRRPAIPAMMRLPARLVRAKTSAVAAKEPASSMGTVSARIAMVAAL